ncbi:hypothetical protein LCGC14_0386420 [marine sediment metagenome]|uniref:DUF5131 family protein n=1 Tax=marine sediment metagenome TaxID=412755 RepID=A0A0F9W9W6_9ZZZZ
MQKTDIEYLDMTWNPMTGCNHWKYGGPCGGGGRDFRCWAMGIANRFKKNYPKGFEPDLRLDRIMEPTLYSPPLRIGVSFMGDLFCDWGKEPSEAIVGTLAEEARMLIKSTISDCPQHTFLFLTKAPWNLHKWSPWPANAWVGATATSYRAFVHACGDLGALHHRDGAMTYISFEPLLSWDSNPGFTLPWLNGNIGWVIIGAARGKMPKLEWVKNIVNAADEADIPVFLKDNLKPLFANIEEPAWMVGWKNVPGEMRQEYPRVGGDGDQPKANSRA